MGAGLHVGYLLFFRLLDRPHLHPAGVEEGAGVEEADVEDLFYTGNRCRRRPAAGSGRAR